MLIERTHGVLLQDSFERSKKWVQELQRQGDEFESSDFCSLFFCLDLVLHGDLIFR